MTTTNKRSAKHCAGLALSIVLVAAPAQAQDVSFIARHDFEAGTSPTFVVVGDFNGDGVLDLVVADAGTYPLHQDGSLFVFLGNGDGTFQRAGNYGVGGRPQFLAVGDFNGDSVQDLAVVLADDVDPVGTGLVLLGNGDGSFQPAQSFGVGYSPQSVAAGDFNGDGLQDLAVANRYSNDVSVLLANGDGSFQPARSIRAGDFPQSVAVGDFNGDGLLDMAVSNNFGTISVLLGNGDGSFQLASNFASGIAPWSIAVDDFNGDGVQDLAVANAGTDPDYTGSVSVFLGNGDGSFQQARNFQTDNLSVYVAVGDFNGDGAKDLAVVNGYFAGSNNVSVLLGNGDGSFQQARNFASGIDPSSVAVGDFNGDGRQDLAVSNAAVVGGVVGSVSVLFGDGDGAFEAARTFATGTNPVFVAVEDFNGDGVLDLVVANSRSSNLSLLLGNGDGTFQAARNRPAGGPPSSIAVGDFNGDGLKDLAVAIGGIPSSVLVLLGNGDGTFPRARVLQVGYAPASVAVGDFDGDGALDLVVAYSGRPGIGPGGVSVLLGRGDGAFQAAQIIVDGRSDFVAVGDFDGDGVLDLAVAYYPISAPHGEVRVLLGNGDATFRARSYAAGLIPVSIAVNDFNGDGRADLVVTNSLSDDVSVLLGNGDGTFQAALNFGAGSYPRSTAVGDFNSDGVQDLAVFVNNARVSLLLGKGDGTFQSPRSFAGSGNAFIAVGDFNGDARPDLVITAGPNNVSVLINNTRP